MDEAHAPTFCYRYETAQEKQTRRFGAATLLSIRLFSPRFLRLLGTWAPLMAKVTILLPLSSSSVLSKSWEEPQLPSCVWLTRARPLSVVLDLNPNSSGWINTTGFSAGAPVSL